MKALKINNVVPTSMGFEIPAGSVLIVNEVAINSEMRDYTNTNMVGACAVSLYASKEIYEDGVSVPVANVPGIPSQLRGTILVADYEGGKSAEAIFIAMAQAVLESLFPAKSEIIDVEPRLPQPPKQP